MKKIFLFFYLILICFNPILGQPNLLESVKKNPNNAIKMCKKFKEYNSKGISASSNITIDFVSKKNNLSPLNAEILSIYVIGLYCPDVT